MSARLRQSPRWKRLLVLRRWLHGVRWLIHLAFVMNDLYPALSWRLRGIDSALRRALRLTATRNTTRRILGRNKTRELSASARELRSRTTLRRLRIFPPILLSRHNRILAESGEPNPEARRCCPRAGSTRVWCMPAGKETADNTIVHHPHHKSTVGTKHKQTVPRRSQHVFWVVDSMC